MDDASIKARVQSQFGAAAQSYVTSAGHAHGDDLARLVELARPQPSDQALDIATGGGHTALALAPHVAHVVASDLTPEMLAAAEAFVRGRGVANVSFEQADAEALPFPDAAFDLVTTRIAPHHFPNPRRYLAQVARVLRPGGRFVLDDNVAPEDPELDAFFNRFEQWRDPSHVRAYRVSEWTAWMQEAGLTVEYTEPLSHKRYDFADWTARMRMPAHERDALEAWLLAASERCRDFFRVTVADGRVLSLSGTFTIIAARRDA
ncbi:MAG TPA: methyltransferase domain-containing protein [Roseiflexaceae bacterium]|nr:methyltransferase domain-containing protein [Roseiflexaceae bacterium]